jgi:hypothetical protein
MSQERYPLASCNLKQENELNCPSRPCYALDRRSGGTLSQTGPEIFENAGVLRGPFPR